MVYPACRQRRTSLITNEKVAVERREGGMEGRYEGKERVKFQKFLETFLKLS